MPALGKSTKRVKIDEKGVNKTTDDTAPVTFGESSIVEMHWQAMAHASGKADTALMAAMARGAKPGGVG